MGALSGGEGKRSRPTSDKGNGDGLPVATANREELAGAIVATTPAAKDRTRTEGVNEEDSEYGRRQTAPPHTRTGISRGGQGRRPESTRKCRRARSTETDELDATTGNTGDMLVRICSCETMRLACDRMVRNEGAGRVDGMGVAKLPAWLVANHGAPPTRFDSLGLAAFSTPRD